MTRTLDNPSLDIHHIDEFLIHLLERIDWSRDLHFQTRTTIDTLDYSGDGFNQGSKLVMAASGAKRFELSTDFSKDSKSTKRLYFEVGISFFK